MTLEKLLLDFYKENRLSSNGGIDKDTFEMKVLSINFKLPNPNFRKKVIHIHDIQHVLNGCDTTWKGEAYIAGWEISTGFWKHFPICIFSFWAMGYSLWNFPKSLYQGYKKGLNNIGIIDLKISKEDFMKMEFDELVRITNKEKKTIMNFFQWLKFIFWITISQIIFLFPLLIAVFVISMLLNR